MNERWTAAPGTARVVGLLNKIAGEQLVTVLRGGPEAKPPPDQVALPDVDAPLQKAVAG